MDILELKKQIIKSVQEASSSDEEFIILENSLNDINFDLLLLHSNNHDQKFYFKNKEADFEILCLNSVEEYNNSSDWKKIDGIISKNEKLFIVGAKSFENNIDQKTWPDLERENWLVPRIAFIRNNQNFTVQVILKNKELTGQLQKGKVVFELNDLLTLNHDNFSPVEKISEENVPSKKRWNQMCEEAQLSFSELNKIVLSRKVVNTFKNDIEAEFIFDQLRKTKKANSYEIFFEYSPNLVFISVTPETLFSYKDQSLYIDSIAGTAPRGESEEEDNVLSTQLLNSEKDLEEHRYVTNWICEKIKTLYQREMIITSLESILKLNHIQHIQTKLKLDQIDHVPTDLINILHPTPAVGGTPQNLAQDYIEKIEKIPRGLYAAPIGILNKKYTNISVGIRSAFIEKNKIHVFAGAGLVPKSQAQSEWIETENKMKNFQL